MGAVTGCIRNQFGRIQNNTRESALAYQGLNMIKLVAKIFIAMLMVGSLSACLIDDGRGGMRGEHMDRGGDEHHGGDRDEHRGDRR
jgi:hypothetical protein